LIYGKRIRLRAIEHTDLLRCQEWLNDPEVIEGLSQYLPLSYMDEEHWFEQAMHAEPEARPLAIEVHELTDWKHVGNIGFTNLEWTPRCAEFGIFIGDKTLWDQGYGTEAVELLLQHGFQTLNLNRIYLRVFSANRRAIRSYEMAGFVLEGTLRQAVYRHGQYADVHIMSILRPEWAAHQEG
jgi:RimJ/RimL family protein N-acetyltransferase